MSEKERQILENFCKAVPKLTASQKEKLISFSEGVAFMAERNEQANEKREAVAT